MIMNKKAFCVFLIFALFTSSCSTNTTNPRILEVEQAIDAIGEINADNEEQIETAKSLYENLLSSEKEQVNNYKLLLEAELSYQKIATKQQIKEEKANLIKQDSYNTLKKAVDLCSQGMEDVKGALDLFVYGYESDSLLTDLAWQMDTLTLRDIVNAVDDIGISNNDLNNLSKRLSVVDKAFQKKGVYDTIDNLLKSVQDNIKELQNMDISIDFLESYYKDVAEYYDFFKGNYKSIITDGGSIVDQMELSSKITNYEYDLLCCDMAASMYLLVSESDYE